MILPLAEGVHVPLCVFFYSKAYVTVCASFKGMCWVTVTCAVFPDWVPADCRFPFTSPSISHSITPSISLSHQPGTRHPARILWWQASTLNAQLYSKEDKGVMTFQLSVHLVQLRRTKADKKDQWTCHAVFLTNTSLDVNFSIFSCTLTIEKHTDSQLF